MNLSSQVTGQTLFYVYVLDNTRDMPPQPLVRPYKKVDRSEGAILEPLETICDVWDALKNTQNTQKLRKTGFSVENPYDTIRLFSVCEYLKLLQWGKLKGGAATRSDEYYIRPLNNPRFEWFSRKIGKCGYYYIQNKKLIVSLQVKHRKSSLIIGNEGIVMECMFWLRSKKPANRTGRHFKRFVEEVIPLNKPNYLKSTISHSTYCDWFKYLSFEVTITDKKKL